MNPHEDPNYVRYLLIKRRDELRLVVGMMTGFTIVMTLLAAVNSYREEKLDDLFLFVGVLLLAVGYGYWRLRKMNREIAAQS